MVENAALHFSKVVYLPKVFESLDNYTWWGTDIYAGAIPLIPRYDGDNLFSSPMNFPVYRHEETERSIMKRVDFQAKQNRKIVTVIMKKSICEKADNPENAAIANFINELSALNSLKVYPSNCFNFTTPLDGHCFDQNCFLRYSQLVVLIDLDYNDEFIIKHYWKAVSYGLGILYYWPNIIPFAQEQITLRLEFLDYKDENLQQKISLWMDTEYLEEQYIWKTSGLPDDIKRILIFQKNNFPCNLCKHVHLRKSSVNCMINKISAAEEAISINNYLDENKKINGMGSWSDIFDAAFISHYSKGMTNFSLYSS